MAQGDADWEDLLYMIDRGDVAPIVGRDLLVVAKAGALRASIYEDLARDLARALGVSAVPDAPSIEDVARAYLDVPSADRGRLYTELRSRIGDLPRAVPEPIDKLAKIEPLRLFVSTTFDDRLVSALRACRSDRVLDLAYKPHATSDDIPPDYGVAVYHLLGKPGGAGEYAVTEEDTLELVLGLQSKLELGQGALKQLGAELRKKQLLFLGCGFPDWLMRFFVRTLRGERFSVEPERRRTRVADVDLAHNKDLSAFLKQCGARVYATEAADFVDELSSRWTARRMPQGPMSSPRRAAVRGALILGCATGDEELLAPLKKRLDRWGIKGHIAPFEAPSKVDLEAAAGYVAFLPDRSLAAGAMPDLLAAWAPLDKRLAADKKALSTMIISLSDAAKELYDERQRGLAGWHKIARKLKRISLDDEVCLRIAEMLIEDGRLDVTLPVRLYCAFADDDAAHRVTFEKHLSRARWIHVWHRGRIEAGASVEETWRNELDHADVVVPLLSVDMIGIAAIGAPKLAREVEYERIREIAGEGTACVAGVVLRACDWEGDGIDALPKNGKPIYGEPGAKSVDTLWKEVIDALQLHICDHLFRQEGP